MKKFLLSILIIFGVIYLSGKVYRIYHSLYLLDTEAVVNIYPNLPNDKMDDYFGLKKGTFDSNNHYVIYSFGHAGGGELSYYYNLPVYNYKTLNSVNCDESFSREKHYRFDRSEIVDNGYLYVRLVNKQYGVTTARSSKNTIAVKVVPISFTFGKINNIIVNSAGAIRYCP